MAHKLRIIKEKGGNENNGGMDKPWKSKLLNLGGGYESTNSGLWFYGTKEN